jgi:hypothetical protein
MMKGLGMADTDKRTLRERIKALISGRTLEEEKPASGAGNVEEYQALDGLFEQAERSLATGRALVADLIADAADTVDTPEEKAAEREIRAARLESMQALSMQVLGTVSGVNALATDMLTDGATEEELKALAGRRHSDADMKVLQSVHDGAVALGAECQKPATAGDTAMALGREAAKKKDEEESADEEKKESAADEKDEEAKVAKDKKDERAACAKCGSVPTVADDPTTCKCERSATSKELTEGENMNREERIKTLLTHEHNPLKSQKALEAATDEELTTLEAHCVEAEERAAADAHELTEDEFLAIAPVEVQEAVAAGRAAMAHAGQEEKPLTEEEYLAKAPESIRTLVAEKKASDAKQKAELITVLKGAQDEFKEPELQKMSVAELARFARAIKVDEPAMPVDFSGLGVTRAASAGSDDVYGTPPDGYAIALSKKAVN